MAAKESRLTEIYKSEKSRGGGLASAIGKRTVERIDPRQIFNQGGILAAVLPAMFKAYKATSGASRTPSPTKETAVSSSTDKKLDDIDKNTRIFAKNSLVLPVIARDMNVMRQNISKLVKLQGGVATNKADAFFKRASEREAEYEAKFGKEPTKVTTPTSEKADKPKGLLSTLMGIGTVIAGAIAPLISSIKTLLDPLLDLAKTGVKLAFMAGGKVIAGVAGSIASVLRLAAPLLLNPAVLGLLGVGGIAWLIKYMMENGDQSLKPGDQTVAGREGGGPSTPEEQGRVPAPIKGYGQVYDEQKYRDVVTQDGKTGRKVFEYTGQGRTRMRKEKFVELTGDELENYYINEILKTESLIGGGSPLSRKQLESLSLAKTEGGKKAIQKYLEGTNQLAAPAPAAPAAPAPASTAPTPAPVPPQVTPTPSSGESYEGKQQGGGSKEVAPRPGKQGSLRKKTEGIVFHHTGGRSLQGAIATLQQKGFGYNYLIERDGRIIPYINDAAVAYHAGNTKKVDYKYGNGNTIGIATLANDDNDVTPEQIKAGADLAKHLSQKYGFPLSNVFGHGEVSSEKMPTEGKTLASAAKSGAGVVSGSGEPVMTGAGVPLTSPDYGAPISAPPAPTPAPAPVTSAPTPTAAKPMASASATKTEKTPSRSYNEVLGFGESGGNYNTVGLFPRQKFELNGKPVVENTLEQIAQYQDEQKKLGTNAQGSGKYAFMYVREFAKMAGLNMNEKFSPENQEKMQAALTSANKKTLSKMLGREPEVWELAAAHSVGAKGYSDLRKAMASGQGGENALGVLDLKGTAATTNPHLNKPVSQVLSDLQTKFSGVSPTAMAPAPTSAQKVSSATTSFADTMRQTIQPPNVVVNAPTNNNIQGGGSKQQQAYNQANVVDTELMKLLVGRTVTI